MEINETNPDTLLHHLKSLAPVLEKINLSVEERTTKKGELNLEKLLELISSSKEKLPYMFVLTFDENGNPINIQLQKNPIFCWPFEVLANNTGEIYQPLESQTLPPFSQTNNNGESIIKFTNPLKKPIIIQPFALLENTKHVLKSLFNQNRNKNPDENLTVVLTGSPYGLLIVGEANREYFQDPQHPFLKNIFETNNTP